MTTFSNSRLALVKSDKIKVVLSEAKIIETEPGGAGSVRFKSDKEMLVSQFTPGRHIYWLANQKCADGAILVVEEGELHCHLIELKSKLRLKDWIHAKAQFAGMLANIYGATGVLDLPKVVRVTCHISYTSENVTAAIAASPIMHKVGLGTGQKLVDASGWTSALIDVLEHTNVPVNRIARNPSTGEGSAAI